MILHWLNAILNIVPIVLPKIKNNPPLPSYSKNFYICCSNNLNTNELWHQPLKQDMQKTLQISRP